MNNFEEYLDFFEVNKKYNGYRENTTFKELYFWLASASQVQQMMNACKFKKPALEGIVVELEKLFPLTDQFNIKDNQFIKQMIGAAIKHILNKYGFIQTVPKSVTGSEWFKNAMHYEYDENAPKVKVLKLEPVIEYISENN